MIAEESYRAVPETGYQGPVNGPKVRRSVTQSRYCRARCVSSRMRRHAPV